LEKYRRQTGPVQSRFLTVQRYKTAHLPICTTKYIQIA
jgi:hypothetical protein